MSGDFEVLGYVSLGVAVIDLTYTAQHMLVGGTDLAAQLVQVYERLALQSENPSIVIHIHAKSAGSPVIRALFRTYVVASRRGGRVACVGYPTDYVESLACLGLLAFPDFALCGDLESAIILLRPKSR